MVYHNTSIVVKCVQCGNACTPTGVQGHSKPNVVAAPDDNCMASSSALFLSSCWLAGCFIFFLSSKNRNCFELFSACCACRLVSFFLCILLFFPFLCHLSFFFFSCWLLQIVLCALTCFFMLFAGVLIAVGIA